MARVRPEAVPRPLAPTPQQANDTTRGSTRHCLVRSLLAAPRHCRHCSTTGHEWGQRDAGKTPRWEPVLCEGPREAQGGGIRDGGTAVTTRASLTRPQRALPPPQTHARVAVHQLRAAQRRQVHQLLQGTAPASPAAIAGLLSQLAASAPR
jgi:hypothetical protein